VIPVNETELARSIKTTFEGPDIGPGWVPVPDLLAVLDGLQNAIVIVVEDLWGRRHKPGPVPSEIQRQATLQFGDVQVGSFGATLTLRAPKRHEPEMFDIQPEAIDRLLTGIEDQVAGRVPDLPGEARRHIETLAARIRRTEDRLILEGGRARKKVVISAETVAPSELLPQAPEARKIRVTGRLLEIDYKDRSAEVWDPLGQMTRIRFTEDQREQVDAARQLQVAVEGRLEVAPSGKSGAITLELLEPVRVDDRFWRAPSIAELAAEQGVRPIEDPSSLVANFWEDDDEEDFLATLRRWRQES
jgi:hypothetical protein